MANWQTNFYVSPKSNNSWADTKIDLKAIIQRIDTLINREDWDKKDVFYWQSKNGETDDDILISTDENLERIINFTIRVDTMRDLSLSFLNDMILVCESFDFVVLDINDNLVTPQRFEEYIHPNAHSYLEFRRK
jgi:hypothetical protein